VPVAEITGVATPFAVGRQKLNLKGAALVVSSLGDPDGEHAQVLDAAAGVRPGDYVTLADLDAVREAAASGKGAQA
jgi:hypothetical protein